ncbi:MAG: hypothetical protein ACTHOD_06870 [Motilibacteraceae bacterium]
MTPKARWPLAAAATLALSLATFATPALAADAPVPASTTSSTSTTSTLSSATRFGVDSPGRTLFERAINPGDYQCATTPLDTYVDDLIGRFSASDFALLRKYPFILDVPTYDALLYGSDTDPRYALRPAEGRSLQNTFRDVKRFWDIQSADIQLHAMHGSVLTDRDRVTRLLQTGLFDRYLERTGTDVPTAVREIVQGVAASPALDGGNNPLFTLNAFAYTAKGDPDPLAQGVPDKLIFGDGILDALKALGLSDVGPRAVMGHEFGHHVQFEDDLFQTTLTDPAEQTRRTELMADAFGTYFTVHARGLALNTQRVLQVEKSFYDVGDCAFDNPGHHGTPNQRLHSSQWAADLASSARPQGFILPSLKLADLFEKELPPLVAPDAA